MSDYFKCKRCGKDFKKSGWQQFKSGATMGASDLGKKFCSDKCEKEFERDHKKSDSHSDSSKSSFSNDNEEKVVVKPQKTAEQIIAEAEADRIERETDRIEKEEAEK
jgi:hypothetical protein